MKDPTGAVVPDATIALSDAATGLKLNTTSRASGEYQLLQIPPATYTVAVTAPGFGSYMKLVELLVSQPATVNFVLAVKGTVETVNVTEAV